MFYVLLLSDLGAQAKSPQLSPFFAHNVVTNNRMTNELTTRSATAMDAPRITANYNQGIEERCATFETEPRWLDVVVVERLIPANLIAADAATQP